MPGGSFQYLERMDGAVHEMQKKKNQAVHGTCTTSSSGSGSLRSFSSATISQSGGQCLKTGSNVGSGPDPVAHYVISEQSTVATAVAGPRKVSTRVVVYGLGWMVVATPNELVGITSMHDLAGQLTVGTPHTSVPTHTMSTLSDPGSGTHTLISVVNPRWFPCWGTAVSSIPLAMWTAATVNRL
jgi:hypothetical protein